MSELLTALEGHAASDPERVAVSGSVGELSYGELLACTQAWAEQLDGRCVGVLLDNGPAWAVTDLALVRRGATCVPLPTFFSDAQLRHALDDAAVDTVVTDQPARLAGLLGGGSPRLLEVAGQGAAVFRLRQTRVRDALRGVAKVTYTSGSTGAPKGVLLGLAAQERVARSLCTATAAEPADRALALLPLGILLENVGSLYAPLLAGARACLPAQHEVGLRAVSGVDAEALLAAVGRHAPSTLILVPEILRVLVLAAEAGWRVPASLRFAAVGGAPVSRVMIERAWRAGLPVYEGYGLSEAASVVSLNRPGAHRLGSVGQPLDHAQVRVDARGEVQVAGTLSDGYLGREPSARKAWLPTGDLGHLDADGYLYLHGRVGNAFSTSFGRNVSPEWVEKELLAEAGVAQAVVFGERRTRLVAVIRAMPGASAQTLGDAVNAANSRLPEYARVAEFLLAPEAFSAANGQLTANGRPRREAIYARYEQALESLQPELVS